MGDLISRKALIIDIEGTKSNVAYNAPYDPEWFTRMADRQHEIIEIIKRQPTVDAEQVRHGRWECVNQDENVYMCAGDDGCGECIQIMAGDPKENKFFFCPNCGAKMDLEVPNEA